MAFTVWDTVQKVNLTLSGGNLTGTSTGQGGVRAADTQTSGKFYYEVTLTTMASTAMDVGVCTGNVNLPTHATDGNQAVYVNKNGIIGVNGVASGKSLSALVNGNIICVAIDLTNKLAWFRIGAAGSWNATSGTANDPATGVGGASFAALPVYAGDYYPIAGYGATVGTVFTANFGASAFTGTVPSGFTSGWTTGTAATTNLVATQVGAEAWVTQTSSEFRATQVGAEAWVTQSHGEFHVTQAGLGTWVTTSHAPVRITQAGNAVWLDISNIVASIIGVSGTSAIGTPTAQVTLPPVQVSVTGVGALSAIGTPSVQVTLLTGRQANAAIGTLAVGLAINVIVSGISATAARGDLLTHITDSNTFVRMTGVGAVAAIGAMHSSFAIALTGFQLTAGIGSPQIITYAGGMALDELTVDQEEVIEEDTMVSLRWSDTEGQSWNDPIHRSLGLTGDYLNSLQWQRLGMARRGRVFEVSWSAPVPTCLLGATVRYDAARS